jgi:hypothetical protein
VNIIFTGVTSFTGFWFANIISQNHNVICPIQKKRKDYTGIKLERLNNLSDKITLVEDAEFGNSKFNYEVSGNVDILCFHHGHVDQYYDNQKFDFAKAIDESSKFFFNFTKVLKKSSIKKIIYTRSIAEPEFRQVQNQWAINYGHYKQDLLNKIKDSFSPLVPIYEYVIPNPIGAFNNQRLIESFYVAVQRNISFYLSDPNSVRDNIPIDLLSRDYHLFLSQDSNFKRIPSWNPMSNIDLLKMVCQKFGLNALNFMDNIEVNQYPEFPLNLIGKDKIDDYSWDQYLFWSNFEKYILKFFC